MDYMKVSIDSYLVVLGLFVSCNIVHGGTCWFELSMSMRNTADVGSFLGGNVTREECCRMEPKGEKYYSKDEMPAIDDKMKLMQWKYTQHHSVIMACQDGCKTFSSRCDDTERCKVNSKGIPRCVCKPYCAQHKLSYKGAVCGDDGKTYSHHCQLLRINCRNNKSVKISYYGECRTQSCEGVKCHQAGEYCITDQYNRPLCIEDRFSKVCEVMPETPVCSTNGVTYKNRFCITAENVLTGSDHLLSHNGPCNSDKLKPGCKQDPKCGACLYRNSTDSYVCQTRSPNCSHADSNRYKVCGDDGNTYPSECLLRLHRYQSSEYIGVKHVGECSASEYVIKVSLARLLNQGEDDDVLAGIVSNIKKPKTRRRRRRHWLKKL